jgi:hypothetical protein
VTWPVLAQAAPEVSDLLKQGGPFALGAGAVLLMGRLGWIRFPPSPEQTADKARLEALTDALIEKQAAALTDAITATGEVRRAMEAVPASLAAAEAANRAVAEEMVRLTAAAAGIAQGLALGRAPREEP